MKGVLENISKKFGITITEFNTLLFAIVVFLIGIVVKNFKISNFNVEEIKFEYNFQDSLFKAIQEKKNKDSTLSSLIEKKVDSDSELLDFSNKKLDRKKNSKKVLSEKSIDINKADVETLIRLPGVGNKTAEKIILYRKSNGKIKKLNELLNVKGIGNKKFSKIKKYIYIKN
ncbi:MAG: hypothetical protein CR986_02895 [Ignavibacteriae bacterium]|nr:MAG: hypothetical protein CR986_02895 [Ignavibacteriota bacterium]